MDLHFETRGEGSPLVLIHSPGVDSREWQEMVPKLASRYRVITYDLRGMGGSPSPQAPVNPLKDLHDLLEHLSLESCSLAGHSMGGQLATEFALTYPDKVDKLILLAPSLTGFPYSEEFTGWMAGINSLAPDVSRMLELSLSGPNYRVVMGSPYRELLVLMHRDYLTRVFTEWKSFEVIWPEPPAMERLEALKTDTLFIHGTVEWADMNRVAEQFRRVPSVSFREIEGADHMLTMTHADRVADHMLEHLG
ncbi:alpha/beta hydrolase [Paenibacillus sp. CC-CFT747]|nr:alpha/beta hydrolase [Paenibacillus sp. CC-CFT747]